MDELALSDDNAIPRLADARLTYGDLSGDGDWSGVGLGKRGDALGLVSLGFTLDSLGLLSWGLAVHEFIRVTQRWLKFNRPPWHGLVFTH